MSIERSPIAKPITITFPDSADPRSVLLSSSTVAVISGKIIRVDHNGAVEIISPHRAIAKYPNLTRNK